MRRAKKLRKIRLKESLNETEQVCLLRLVPVSHEWFWQVSKKIPPPSLTCIKIFLQACDSSDSTNIQRTFSPVDIGGHGLLSGAVGAWWLEVNGEIWEADKRAMAGWKWLLNGQRVQVNALVFDLILWGMSTQHLCSAGCSPQRWTVLAGQLVSSSQTDESGLYLIKLNENMHAPQQCRMIR